MNLQAQKEDLQGKENIKTNVKETSLSTNVDLVKEPSSTEECAQDWDPEDYVRYVVKWKGLPSTEMTWEYWKDIKENFVNVAEDYWLRQRKPVAKNIKVKAHPNIRDFKKLSESPLFGVSNIPRPIADLNNNKVESQVEEEVYLRLREYQLEGVNWLLWNWWNHRSCILAGKVFNEYHADVLLRTGYSLIFLFC